MNTPTPSDPRSLAHRLTTVGHALHHRLFAQLRDSDLHPKTVMGPLRDRRRLDAPWSATASPAAESASAPSPTGDGSPPPATAGRSPTRVVRSSIEWMRPPGASLPGPGRRDRSASTPLSTRSPPPSGSTRTPRTAGPREPRGFGFGPGPFGPGSGRGFGPGMRGGPRFGGRRARPPTRCDGGNAHHGFGPRHDGHTDGHRPDGDHAGPRTAPARTASTATATPGHRHERGHRAAERPTSAVSTPDSSVGA